MAVVRSDLELTIADALRQVSQVEEAIAVATTNVPVSLEIDTTKIDQDVSAALADLENLEVPPVSVDVEADIANAEAEIAALDAEPISVDVEADTGGAQAALDDLGGAAGGAATGIDSVTTASTDLGTSIGTTSGLLEGGIESIGDLSGAAGAAAAAVAALVATTTVLFNAGLEAESSQQAFNAALGESADRIEQIQILGLDTTLGDLVVSLGASDEAVRNSTIGLFNFAEGATGSAEEAELFVQQLLVLSATIAAQRPDLDLNQIFDQLSTGLGRGGRALQQFGLNIRSADIQEFATSTGKATEDLEQFDLVAAGLALALQDIDDPLSTINTGLQNSGVQFASLKERVGETLEELGRPIVAPILDTLTKLFDGLVLLGPLLGKELGPELQELGESLAALFREIGEVLEPLLPLIGGALLVALKAAVGATTTFTDLLAVGAEIIQLFALDIATFIEEVRQIPGVSDVFNDLADGFERLGAGIQTVEDALPGLGDEATKATLVVSGLDAGFDNAVTGMERFAVISVKTANTVADTFTDRIGEAAATLPLLDDAAFAAAEAVATALGEDAIAALEAFASTTVDSLNLTLSAFEDFNEDGETSLLEFTQTLRNQVLEQQQFLNDVNELRERGATDLALALFNSGEDAASAAREAVQLNDDQLAEQERLIDETLTLNGVQVVGAEELREDLVYNADQTAVDVGKALGPGFLSEPLSKELAKAKLIAAEGGFGVGQSIGDGIVDGLDDLPSKVEDKLALLKFVGLASLSDAGTVLPSGSSDGVTVTIENVSVDGSLDPIAASIQAKQLAAEIARQVGTKVKAS